MLESHFSCIRISDAKICPFCYGKNIIKNGTTKTKKQQFCCKNCKKRFLDFYTYNAYRKNINDQIIQFTKEGIGIRSTARVLKISATTILKRIKEIAENVKQPPIPKEKIYQLDEIRTFIKRKKKQIWIVYALEQETKKVVSFNVGRRTNTTLSKVIKSLECSGAKKIYTDKLKNYKYLIDPKIHSTKNRGINHIERKNLTLRTHLKRLNRRTICFSRSMAVLVAVLKIYFWG